MDKPFRLAAHVVVEPLVNSWSAYSHCVSPLTGSLTAHHYQVPNLRQYLASPIANVTACENPKLRAGRFVNVPVARAGEVQALLDKTERECADNLRFAHELMRFQNFLNANAGAGLPMAPFYDKLPPSLRGHVELCYDYFARPHVRVIEASLYHSPYHKKNLQCLRLFGLGVDQERDFVFSTPRLPSPNEMHWQVPFDDERVDRLFALDAAPQPLHAIRDLLGLDSSANPLLADLLDERAPARRPAWNGEGIRIRHFGHACVLIEYKGLSILVDPCISTQPRNVASARPTFDDLPEHIDYALVTHNHHDHFCLETLLRIRHRLGCLVVPRASGAFYGDISLKLLARSVGFRNVVELDTLERIAFDGGEIVAVPFLGEHADLPHAKNAYVVRAGAQRMLFAADSDCLDAGVYERLHELLGPLHTVFLGTECVGAPMSWTCGALFPVKPTVQQDQSRRQHGCDAQRGLRLLQAVKAERLFVYAMGLEPWYEWLLGLAYTEDSEQIKQMKKILADAAGKGIDAKLLVTSMDLRLADR